MEHQPKKRSFPCRSVIGFVIGPSVIIGIALIVVIMLSFLLSKNPQRTLHFFFFGPFRNTFSFGNLINAAIPLIFGGLGITISMRGGSFNLGGEGQLYSGAFVSTIVAIALAPLGLLGAVLALGSGALVGGLLAGFSGFLNMKWKTSELITSFLLSNAVLLIVSYLIAGPFSDPDTNLIATRKIPDAFRLSKILEPSNLSSALYIALITTVLVYLYLFKTKSGYELRIQGINPRFAQYGGIRTGWYRILPMILSGACYGFGGALTIFGTYYACMKDFSGGMGWNGIAVALIAKQKPAAIIPAALFFAYIESGARSAMLHSDVTFEIAAIVQSVIFFLVTSAVLQSLGVKKRGAL